MRQELRTQFTDRKEPVVVIEGLEKIIKRDLAKHKTLLAQSKEERASFRTAVSHQIKKKKFYKSLLGGEKYDDASLWESIMAIGVDIRHMSDKVKLAEEAISHHSLIVDTLTAQLSDQNKKLKALVEYRRESDGFSD